MGVVGRCRLLPSAPMIGDRAGIDENLASSGVLQEQIAPPGFRVVAATKAPTFLVNRPCYCADWRLDHLRFGGVWRDCRASMRGFDTGSIIVPVGAKTYFSRPIVLFNFNWLQFLASLSRR